MPERLIRADPDFFLTRTLDTWCRTPGAIVDEARDAYRVAFRDPRTIHAICEDYRANASIDIAIDQADFDAGKRIAAPMFVLWEQPAGMQLPFDPLAVWRRWADDVQGQVLDCSHFLPEERPNVVSAALQRFFVSNENGESSAM